MIPATASPPRPADAAHPAAPILVVEDVSKHFATPDGPITALNHLSFDVMPAEFLAVIGPSGCGKSTLFNLIGGLVGGYDGHIAVAGERVYGPHSAIGMVF